MTIITFCGLIGSGKDTAANYLVSEHGFQQESFAASLKDAVASIFNWDRELLEGKTPEARLWRDQVDTWWATRLGMPDLTPRWILQYWGTEVCRIGFHNDIWIASLENRLRTRNSNVVISDVRFPNEIKAIKNLGGYVIRIKRGEDPAWYKHAIIVNQQDRSSAEWARSAEILRNLGIHSSETAWAGAGVDVVINNMGSIQDLHNNIEKVIKSLELDPPSSTILTENREFFDSLHTLS